jgi:5-methyltetrahydropteroyltriglutamate--homocysteine methyltransferase
MASEPETERAYSVIRDCMLPDHLVFIGVIDLIDPSIETVAEVWDRILEAAAFLPGEQLDG